MSVDRCSDDSQWQSAEEMHVARVAAVPDEVQRDAAREPVGLALADGVFRCLRLVVGIRDDAAIVRSKLNLLVLGPHVRCEGDYV